MMAKATKLSRMTADEAAAARVTLDRRYRKRQRLTVDWVKLHQPDVWAKICAYVEQAIEHDQPKVRNVGLDVDNRIENR
tara:strand:+ start:823 stop:1059 length:237 start_codon:yes stop_codon:yes gene_type:complete